MSEELIQEQVIKIVADELGFGIHEVTIESRLNEDLAADSLDTVTIIFAIEKVFEIVMDDVAFEETKIVQDIIREVNKKLNP